MIPITIARLCRFDSANATTDPTLHEAPYICWTQAELSYAVMAATFPTARRLIADLNTYYNGGRLGTSYATGYQGQSFPMNTLQSSVYHSKVTNPARQSLDNGSQEMIIKRKVSVEVIHESKDTE